MDFAVHLYSKQASDRRFVKEVKRIWEAQRQSTSVSFERLLQALGSMGVFTETEIGYCTLIQLVSCI
ncbi:MAG: hypothetical protein V7K41_11645 [Nostoc sp.]|uniref:hypothetical protein n=1 Tax=Nostoc sp. TaxID=1180 RepID=UPI002FF77C5D